MKSIDIGYKSKDELESFLLSNNKNLLCAVHFSDETLKSSLNNHQFAVNLKQMNGGKHIEVWATEKEIEYGQFNEIKYSKTDDFLVASLSASVNFDNFENEIQEKYAGIITFARHQGFSSFIRMWNYFPGINDHDNTTERYKQFCSGRHLAFKINYHNFQSVLPAGTAVGSKKGNINIYFLAARSPGLHIKNPRQLCAYKYPDQYGKHSPSFARATFKQWNDNANLFISGTASIVGHESRHHGDCEKQVQETFRNIHALLDTEYLKTLKLFPHQFNHFTLDVMKVYVRDPKYLSVIENEFKREFDWHDKSLFLIADICRRELLLEIEGIWSTEVS